MSQFRNKSKVIFLLTFLIFSLACILLIGSSSSNTGIILLNGSNNVSLNVTAPFYAGDILKLNPEIEVVSYNAGGKTIGYVNAFGGVGQNFEIESGTQYNIFVSENTTLTLPY